MSDQAALVVDLDGTLVRTDTLWNRDLLIPESDWESCASVLAPQGKHTSKHGCGPGCPDPRCYPIQGRLLS